MQGRLRDKGDEEQSNRRQQQLSPMTQLLPAGACTRNHSLRPRCCWLTGRDRRDPDHGPRHNHSHVVLPQRWRVVTASKRERADDVVRLTGGRQRTNGAKRGPGAARGDGGCAHDERREIRRVWRKAVQRAVVHLDGDPNHGRVAAESDAGVAGRGVEARARRPYPAGGPAG